MRSLFFLTFLAVFVSAFPKQAPAMPPAPGYPHAPESDWLTSLHGREQSPYRPLSALPYLAPLVFDKPWRVLVVMIEFSDMPAKGTPAYFKEMLFGDREAIQGDEAYPWPSMAEFYGSMSTSMLRFEEPDIVSWVRAPKPYTYYTSYGGAASDGCHGLGPSRNGVDAGAPLLVQAALDAAVAKGFDLADYDNDGDQQPEGVFIVHAGFGAEQTYSDNPCSNDGGDLWSHVFSTTHGEFLVTYLLGPARSDEPGSKSGLSTMGVWAHEFGHILDLPDIYASNWEVNGNGVGCWDLMGYAIRSCSNDFDGDDPGADPNEMSAWTRTQLGWTSPKPVTANVCRQVEPVQYGGEVFKVTPNPSKPGDYFLVSYRARVGLDKDMLSFYSGENKNRVCVWHIDDSLASEYLPNGAPCFPNQDMAACKDKHYGISLVEADGNYSLPSGSAYVEHGDCLAPDMSMSSDDNRDLRPWDGAIEQHWRVETGTLAEKGRIRIIIDDTAVNEAPEIVGVPKGAYPGVTWKYQAKLASQAGMPYWELLKYPAGMSIETDTGLVTWAVPVTQASTVHKVSIRVENCGGAITQDFRLSVGELEPQGGCSCAQRREPTVGDLLPFLVMAGWVLRRRWRGL